VYVYMCECVCVCVCVWVRTCAGVQELSKPKKEVPRVLVP
jgi:hypothetical protein